MSYAVVQVRGEVDMNTEVEDTLDMLNLGDVNNMSVLPDNDSTRGMLTKVNDYVAFGNPSAETLALLLERRGETQHGDDLTDDYVSENTDYGSVEELAEALVEDEVKLKDVGIKPTLRLHPPRKGHDGIKKSYTEGGVLGNHGDEIDDLLERMR